MALSDLTASEQQTVRECLAAAADGPFFPDWEFQTLFGVERSEVKIVLDAWPNIDETNESVFLAINNSMNNLLGYPHGLEREWSHYISAHPEDVARILQKWRGERISNYFDGLR
jgi:hypothetical protein